MLKASSSEWSARAKERTNMNAKQITKDRNFSMKWFLFNVVLFVVFVAVVVVVVVVVFIVISSEWAKSQQLNAQITPTMLLGFSHAANIEKHC